MTVIIIILVVSLFWLATIGKVLIDCENEKKEHEDIRYLTGFKDGQEQTIEYYKSLFETKNY